MSRRGRATRGFVATVAFAITLAACGSSDDATGGSPTARSDEPTGTITVYAASSLTGAFQEIAAEFEAAHPGAQVAFEFGSSGELSTAIIEGAPADVFASASPKNMDAVVDAGLAQSPTTLVSNTAIIVTAPGNPKGVETVADLARPDLKVAFCVATAPCGVVAAAVFEKAGVSVTAATNPPDVKSTLAVVESGEVDAGIVYVTDALAAADRVSSVEIPASQNESTQYPIAVLTESANGDLADAFVKYVKDDGLAVLTAAGFASP